MAETLLPVGMNTSKFFLAGLTVATLSAAPVLLADDTDAQTKAREALEQKMSELGTKPATTAPAAPVAPKPAPAPVAAPAPVPAPAPAPVAAPVTSAPVKPTAQVAPAPAPAPVAYAEDPAAARAREEALQRALQQASGFSDVPPPSNTGKVTETQLEAASAKTPQPAANYSSAKAPHAVGYKPLEAPALPIPADKQTQLADLLRQYRADQITPEQYHMQRAKIMGAP